MGTAQHLRTSGRAKFHETGENHQSLFRSQPISHCGSEYQVGHVMAAESLGGAGCRDTGTTTPQFMGTL